MTRRNPDRQQIHGSSEVADGVGMHRAGLPGGELKRKDGATLSVDQRTSEFHGSLSDDLALFR